MDKPVILFGAGPLSIAALNIFNDNEIIVYGILDDDTKLHGSEIMEATVLSSTEDDSYLKILGKKSEAFVALEDVLLRKRIVKVLNEERDVMPVNAIHSNCHIAKFAEIGHGNLIDSGTVIGAKAKLGNHCILHSNSTIEPDVSIGDYTQIGPGSVISSGVSIGNDVFIGAGAVIVSGVSIAQNARIGAGSVVVSNVKKDETVFGNPAKSIDVDNRS